MQNLQNVLNDLKYTSEFGDMPKKESIDQSIQVIEKFTAIKNAYIANGGKADDFDAMDEQDWTEAFNEWFKAMEKINA